MTRRNLFRSIGIATAALYLRIAPSLIKAAEFVAPTDSPVEAITDDAFRQFGDHMRYKGRVLTHEQMFEIVAIKRGPEREAYLKNCPKFDDGKLVSRWNWETNSYDGLPSTTQ